MSPLRILNGVGFKMGGYESGYEGWFWFEVFREGDELITVNYSNVSILERASWKELIMC